MPNAKDRIFKLGTGLHKALIRVSGGRIGGRGAGMPVVILTTTGRKSGQKRETVLTSPLTVGDSPVLIASYGGDDRHPAWFLNLRADPAVEVEIDGEKTPRTARIATAEEKAEHWDTITATYKGYANYQSKSSRDIPVIFLDPRE